MDDSADIKLDRRGFLIVGATAAMGTTLPSAAAAEPAAVEVPHTSSVSFHVNGKAYALELDTRA